MAVPLKIADLFYTKNGVPITEDKTWNYDDRFELRKATANDKYFIKEGYTTANLNFDREVRYYASLGFDGAVWFGQGVTDETKPIYVPVSYTHLTQGGGFCLFHPESETFTSYNSTDGLPSDVVYQIVEDKDGQLWLTTNNGLVYFQPKTETMKVYTTANGLLGDQFNYRSSFEDENGLIYFGGCLLYTSRCV